MCCDDDSWGSDSSDSDRSSDVAVGECNSLPVPLVQEIEQKPSGIIAKEIIIYCEIHQ